MSLRTDYTGALDVALAAARVSGKDSIDNNLVAISAAIAAEAARGIKAFTYNAALSGISATDARLEGPLWDAYRSGILAAFATQDIMVNEVAIELNTTDISITTVNINFTF
jgi:hypothetical protein